MTLSIAAPGADRSATHSGAGLQVSFSVLVLVGTLVSVTLCWSKVLVVWRTGTFFDTDDAMRMVQVRAWMAGQGWYDLTVHRLDPPAGLLMHWSRIVDVPLALLIRTFELLASPTDAERLARIAFPLGLQAGLIAATVFTGGVLVGPSGRLPAMLLAVLSSMQFGQFVPGRVDHHAPQITLLMLMTGCAAQAMLHGRRTGAAGCALAMALSLAISLENLPFIAVTIAALALTWVASGRDRGQMLQCFGLALTAGAAAMFIATVPPWRYGVTITDAFSLPHAIAAVMGGTALAVLPLTGTVLQTRARRAGAGVAAFGLLAGAVVALCPGVLASPYGQLDPVLKAVWLSHVTEALPLGAALTLRPQLAGLFLAPLLVGLVSAAAAVWLERGRDKAVWLLVTVLILVGLGGACWEVRVITSVAPLGLLGGVWLYAKCIRFSAEDGAPRASHAVAAVLALLTYSPWSWALLPMPSEAAEIAEMDDAAGACREADHVVPLAALSAGTIFAPIDSGSHLLAHTGLSVFGAPYHRNNYGNRTVVDGFSAPPAEAERIVKDAHARYVALCPGQVQAGVLALRSPEGLAAQILAGHPPAWLERLEVPNTPYLVFAVK